MASRSTKSIPSYFMKYEEIEAALLDMELDNAYNTESVYNPNTILYPNNKMSFKDKHLAYLKSNKATNPEQYLSNLKLMTKIR